MKVEYQQVVSEAIIVATYKKQTQNITKLVSELTKLTINDCVE
jgi:hypothetical protein